MWLASYISKMYEMEDVRKAENSHPNINHVDCHNKNSDISYSYGALFLIPVNVVLTIGWQVIVDNQRHLLDINSSGLKATT